MVEVSPILENEAVILISDAPLGWKDAKPVYEHFYFLLFVLPLWILYQMVWLLGLLVLRFCKPYTPPAA